jgi:transketolase
MSANDIAVDPQPKLPVYDNREAFADELERIAEHDERIVAVCNDSVGSSKLGGFAARFPDRLINVGIAEQNMVGVAAGLASSGFIPFACGASPFLTGRSLEQIKVDVAYSQNQVILCGMSPGVAYGALGPTHHSLEDYSWLRPLPGLDIMVPADRAQTRAAVRDAVANPRPLFLRIGRYKVPDVAPADPSEIVLQRGRFQVVRPGEDVTLIGIGSTVSVAVDAASELTASGVSARVLNASSLAPIDSGAILDAASTTRAIVTVEEANTAGGLGAAVAMLVAQLDDTRRVPLRVLGFEDFAPTGSAPFLLDRAGLSGSAVARAAHEALDHG